MGTRTSVRERLEELAPEELRYVLEACRVLRSIGFDVCGEDDDDKFDRDELGVDPEEDYD